MSRFFAMLRAKNYQIWPMFHGVIHKITLAQFFWDTVYTVLQLTDSVLRWQLVCTECKHQQVPMDIRCIETFRPCINHDLVVTECHCLTRRSRLHLLTIVSITSHRWCVHNLANGRSAIVLLYCYSPVLAYLTRTVKTCKINTANLAHRLILAVE